LYALFHVTDQNYNHCSALKREDATSMRFTGRSVAMVALLLMAALVLAACPQATTPAAPAEGTTAETETGTDATPAEAGEETAGEEEAQAPAAAADLKIGLVTDVGRVNDRSFNQSAWEGVQAAAQTLGLDEDDL